MNLPMGYICEKLDEGCKIKENSPLIFDRYEIIPPKNPETVDFDQARLQCQLKGAQWDLAVFNSKNEFSEIQSRIENNCVDDIAYWVGYTEENEKVLTVSGDEIFPGSDFYTWKKTGTLNWNRESNPAEPNDKMGNEKCVRMKNGKFNDAMCFLTHTGARRQMTGMGFICEKHEHNDPGTVIFLIKNFPPLKS